MSARTIPTPRSWLWLCGIVGLAMLVVVTFKIVLMVFAGVLAALLLKATSTWISRVLHWRYVWALLLVLIVLLGVTTLLIVLAAPTIAEQWSMLWQELPKAIAQLRQKLDRLLSLAGSKPAPDGAHGNSGKALDLAGVAVTTLGGSLEVLSGLVVAFFIGLYGAAQPAAYRRAALALAPHAQRERVDAALTAATTNLTRWLWGRLVAMLFVGITTTVLFQVFQLPLAFGLGALAGVLTFIEYAGAVISAIPPILIALTQSSSTALAVALLFVVLHIIEGYVLTPLLARATVHLPPAITLATQAILGSLAGAVGLTFSTPLLIVAISCAEVISKPDSAQTPAR
jgi:predicted PurR-regulated permease PerM